MTTEKELKLVQKELELIEKEIALLHKSNESFQKNFEEGFRHFSGVLMELSQTVGGLITLLEETKVINSESLVSKINGMKELTEEAIKKLREEHPEYVSSYV